MNRLTLMRTQSPFFLHVADSVKKPARVLTVSLVRPSPSSSGIAPNALSPHARLRSTDPSGWTGSQAAAPASAAASEAAQSFMMQITVDARGVTELRHLVMGNCGELVSFMRIQPVAHATKMKVWLCLSRPAADRIMDIVMRTLPSAEFGAIVRV